MSVLYLPPADSAQSFTVDSQVLVQSSFAGAHIHLPFSTHVIAEKRDKLDLHVSSWRTHFLKLLADMDTHLSLTRKTPLRPLHLLYFPRLLRHLFCVGSHYFISPPPGQHSRPAPRSSAQFSSDVKRTVYAACVRGTRDRVIRIVRMTLGSGHAPPLAALPFYQADQLLF